MKCLNSIFHFVCKKFLLLLVLSVIADNSKAQIIRTIAGNGTAGFSGDGGLAINASLNGPSGVITDKSGNIYIADMGNNRIRKIDAVTKIITTIAGKDSVGYSGDGGPAKNAKLSSPTAMAFDKGGNIVFTDYGNNVLRKIDITTGTISTIAGGGSVLTDGVVPTSSKLNTPFGVTVDTAGNIYISGGGNTIRKIDYATNIISTFKEIHLGGWLAFMQGKGITSDRSGNLYVAFPPDHSIAKVTASGIDSIFAGTGSCCYSGGTSALSTRFNYPYATGIDTAGDLFVVDTYNGMVRRIDMKTRMVYDFVTSSASGLSIGDEGPAILARLNQPLGICFDSNNDMFIADYGNNRIRYVCRPGITVPKADTINFCVGDTIPSPLYSGIGQKWYSAPTGGVATDTTPTIKTDKAGNYYYFVSQTGPVGCESIRTKLFVNVYDFPSKPTILKSGASVSVSSAYKSYQWYHNNLPVAAAVANSFTMAASGSYFVVVTNEGGCTAYSDTILYDPSSIRTFTDAQNRPKIFPNPTNMKVHIKSPLTTGYTLSDVTGRELVKGEACCKAHEIDLSSFSNGFYILKIYDESGTLIATERIQKTDLTDY